MTRIVVAAFVAALAIAGAANATTPAHTSEAPTACLEMTTRTALNTGAIVQGLGLAPDAERAVRARLTQYWSASGFVGLGGLGLTAAQIATIQARINAEVTAMQKHPLGWPCAPFSHRARTVAFVRKILLGNGYESDSIRFYGTAPRQILFNGIKNGVELIGSVARSGKRQITIRLTSASPVGGTYVFAAPFDV